MAHCPLFMTHSYSGTELYLSKNILVFFNRQDRLVTTLCFYIFLIKTFYRHWPAPLLVYHVWHVASPRIKEANYFIVSHIACSYTCLKHCSFSSITLLIMPRLSEHERSGAIGMLQAGVQLYNLRVLLIMPRLSEHERSGAIGMLQAGVQLYNLRVLLFGRLLL